MTQLGKEDRELLKQHEYWMDYLNWCFGPSVLIPTSYTGVMDYVNVFHFLNWEDYDRFDPEFYRS